MLPKPYLYTGLDHFKAAFPPNLITITEDPTTEVPGWRIQQGPDGLVDVHTGPLGRQIITGIYRAVAALSDSGLNVIVESVLRQQWELDAAVEILHDHPLYFVLLDLSLEAVEERERSRSDKGLGGARYFYESLYNLHDVYDLRVDAEENDPESCARIISKAVASTHRIN